MNKLVFGDYEVNKKEFYKSKQGLKLKDVIVKNIAVSNKVKINDKTVNITLDILMMIMWYH